MEFTITIKQGFEVVMQGTLKIEGGGREVSRSTRESAMQAALAIEMAINSGTAYRAHIEIAD